MVKLQFLYINISRFYLAKRSAARYCHDKLSVCLSVRVSVRLSVTLVDCDHMRWNSSEIISRLISLTFLLSEVPKSRIYSEGNTPKF